MISLTIWADRPPTPPKSPRSNQPLTSAIFAQRNTLRQFIHACWRQFLGEHARQKKWTKGRKAEAIYALVVNRLEPLAYFSPAASDNLRAIGDLMKAAAREAGTADLAAVESEIKKLDFAIDAFVYELYGLTEEEIRMVEGASRGKGGKGA